MSAIAAPSRATAGPDYGVRRSSPGADSTTEVGVLWTAGMLPEAAGLVVGDRLEDLLAGVHHERSHPRDGLADGPAAEDQDVEVGAAALLAGPRRPP